MIEIRDDGIGMEAQELEKLKLHLPREEISDNIGLQNVWMRMRLMFGRDTQIMLASKPGEGLAITFILEQDSVRVKGEQHE